MDVAYNFEKNTLYSGSFTGPETAVYLKIQIATYNIKLKKTNSVTSNYLCLFFLFIIYILFFKLFVTSIRAKENDTALV